MLMDFIGKSRFLCHKSLDSGSIQCRLRRKSKTWPALKLYRLIGVSSKFLCAQRRCPLMSFIWTSAGVQLVNSARLIGVINLAS